MTLSLTEFEKLYEEACQYETPPLVIIVPDKVIATLKKKYPKEYKEWLKTQKQQYKCSFQKTLDKWK